MYRLAFLNIVAGSLLLLQLFLCLQHTTFVKACGTSTHISIAHEAVTFFKGSHYYGNDQINYEKILSSHQDAFVAGNPYPDAMYPSICFGGKYHETAEDTHWAPFLNATVNYIRENYPQPWDEETEKLVAFMFGFVSHQIADVTWHSLGIDQGLIRTMADLDFHGVYDKAHTDADVGGDMLTQLYHSDRTISTSSWYIPVGDLYNIYKDYYHGNETIPKMVIELCSELLYIEYIAEKLAGAKIFQPFVRNSPFLYNHMENYFLGGIHDMASWTEKIWHDVIFMLENGTEDCNMEHNTLFMNCTGYLPPRSENSRKSIKKPRNPGRSYPLRTDSWKSNHVIKTRTKRGVYFSPGKLMQEAIRNMKWKPLEENNLNETETKPNSYSQIGRAMTKIKILDKDFIAISAPTFSEKGAMLCGKVWVISSEILSNFVDNEDIHNLDEIASNVLYGNESMSKFGWSVAASFYNDDDYQDLIISAPTTGSKQLKYNGAIFVYFGSKSGLSSEPNVTLTGFRNETSNTTYANFGYTLAENLNTKGFIMTGSPFYPYKVSASQNGVIWTKSDKYFEWFRNGYGNFSWFGYSVIHEKLSSGDDITIVGSPTDRKCFLTNCSYNTQDRQSVGFVVTFLNYESSAYLSGTEEYEGFGGSVAIGKPYGVDSSYVIAIGSPGKTVTAKIFGVPITLRQAGMVKIYNLTNLDINPQEENLLATFYGDRAYGRFGDFTKFGDVDGDGDEELIISAPRRSRDFTEEIYGGGEGAVYIFKLASVNDDVTGCPEFDMTPCPGAKAWKYFFGKETHARFGTSFQLLNVRNTMRLLVSSPTSSKLFGFQAGLVQNLKV